jgi:hypothetical protein
MPCRAREPQQWVDLAVWASGEFFGRIGRLPSSIKSIEFGCGKQALGVSASPFRSSEQPVLLLYPSCIKVSDAEFEKVLNIRNGFHVNGSTGFTPILVKLVMFFN